MMMTLITMIVLYIILVLVRLITKKRIMRLVMLQSSLGPPGCTASAF